jgi:NADPH:quinone reductase-like Zn-dependent oxidoreductase
MKALVLKEKNCLPEFIETAVPMPGEGDALVQLEAAALNHRDLWIIQDKYPGIQPPVILGSDGAGWVGERAVVIQPGMNWGDNPNAQGKNYHILGLPTNGTFAQLIAVKPDQLFDKPKHLDFVQASALPLGGLTAYRTLFTRCRIQSGEKMLVTGIGGGVALFCLQFALAASLEVWVTSGSDEKIERAKAMGAAGGANYRSAEWAKSLESTSGGFDVIIDSAGGEGFPALLKLCKPGARIGMYGGSKGAIPQLSPQLLFWRQISILGSTMGTNEDFTAMLDFVHRHKIIPVVDSVFPVSEGKKAFERMASGGQFGKIVLQIT